jgi:hypothetical protein
LISLRLLGVLCVCAVSFSHLYFTAEAQSPRSLRREKLTLGHNPTEQLFVAILIIWQNLPIPIG